MKNIERIDYIDLLKVISLICVMFIHIVGNTIYTFNLENINALKFYHTIEHFAYFAIPLFVIISGYLFLYYKKEIKFKDFFLKHILKILLIIFIIGSIEILIEEYYVNKTISLSIIPTLIKNIISGNLWMHMWFLYMILGLYILTPAIKTYFDNADKINLLILLIILFLFTVLFPYLSIIFNIQNAFIIPISSTYLFCFILGGYLGKYKFNKKIIYFLIPLSILYFGITVYNFYFNNINNFEEVISYLSPFTLAFSTLIFITFTNIKLKNIKLKSFIQSLSNCSLGIYVLHQFYINIFYKFLHFDLILKCPYILLFIYSFILYLLTYITVYLLKKIKIINKYLL